MAAFGGLILTNRGRNLQAKAQAGAQLNFNRIAMGDGNLGGQSILELNALISQKKSLNINKLKALTGGKAVVGGVFSNQDLATGFYWREIGVYAQDPDLGEILYCYANAGVNAEYIPAGGGSDALEKAIDIITIVGNAANVTATIDQSLIFASQQDLDDLREDVDESIMVITNTVNSHMADYEYKPATVVGRQIRIPKQSNSARLPFKLLDNIEAGDPITISDDGGTTSKPLVDNKEEPIVELEKGYLEVIADATFFTLKSSGKGGIEINALLAEYEIEAGQSLNVGDLVEFINNKAVIATTRHLEIGADNQINSVSSSYIFAVTVDEEQILITYKDASTTYGTAVVVKIIGNIVTVGTPFAFNLVNINANSPIAKIDTDKFIVVYANASGHGVARVLTISDMTITAGTAIVYEASITNQKYIISLETNKALVVYGGNGVAKVLTVSGTTISAGTGLVFGSSNMVSITGTRVNSNRVIIGFTHNSPADTLCRTLGVSGSTVTVQGTATFTAGVALNGITFTLVDTDIVLATYGDTARILTLSGGGGITLSGTPITYNSTGVAMGACVAVKLEKDFVMILFTVQSSNVQRVAIFKRVGTTIVTIRNDLVGLTSPLSLGFTALIDNKAVLPYSGASNFLRIREFTNMLAPQGLSVENGVGGQIKKFYDWRL